MDFGLRFNSKSIIINIFNVTKIVLFYIHWFESSKNVFSEVFGRFVSFEVLSLMDDFLLDSDMRVVVVVCCRDKSCVWKAVAEASGTNLSHDLVEKPAVYGSRHKDVWVALEHRNKKLPLSIQVTSIEVVGADHTVVLASYNVCFWPITEKADIWHQVKVRFPY